MKKFKKQGLILITILTIIFSDKVCALNYKSDDVNLENVGGLETNDTILIPSQNSYYDLYDYVIDKYDINIVVNENNTFDITETITTNFKNYKHGIIRTIPLKNKVTRLDGTTSSNRTQISNLSVNNEYKTSKESGKYKIKIGSVNTTLIGEQVYIIKYTYNLGKDPLKDCDELYYNIIGNEWDTVIGNITFHITMPKEFDSNKLGFSSGVFGSTDSSKIKYIVDGNEISGSYDGILNVEEALTVRLELPEGYFVGAGLVINFMDYVIFLIPISFLGISIFLWYKFGRDEQVIETVEFYPPEGFNSLEIGFLYKGEADNKDVTSLLIYLANKGYIKISEIEKKSLFSRSKGFKITKLKEYDGNNINERIFFKGLFKKKSKFTSLFSLKTETPVGNINEVTSIDLEDNFYITMRKILLNINNQENINKIFEKSVPKKNIIIILMIITYLLITILPILEYYGEVAFVFLLIILPFSTIGLAVLLCSVFCKWGFFNKMLGFLWGGIFGGMPWVLIVLRV